MILAGDITAICTVLFILVAFISPDRENESNLLNCIGILSVFTAGFCSIVWFVLRIVTHS